MPCHTIWSNAIVAERQVLPSIINEVLKSVVAQYNAGETRGAKRGGEGGTRSKKHVSIPTWYIYIYISLLLLLVVVLLVLLLLLLLADFGGQGLDAVFPPVSQELIKQRELVSRTNKCVLRRTSH